MRVLVTGGLGVNGCWVTRDLLEMGHEPVVFDNRPDFTLLRDIEGQFPFIEGDITDLDALERACRDHGVERICHLAAVYPKASNDDPYRGFQINAMATVNVLEAAKRTGVQRVSYTSSMAALSDMTPEHLDPQMVPVSEAYPSYPVSFGVYGATKVASELMGIQYSQLFGIEFAALRYAAIYGIGKHGARHGNLNFIWAEMVENAIEGIPTNIPKGGDQRLDVTYARDVARSVTLAAFAPNVDNHIYHIGSGRTWTLQDFAEAIRAAVPGAQVEVGPGLDPRGLGPRGYFRMDISRAKEDLGYEPRYTPMTAVQDWVEWTQKLELRPEDIV